MRTLRAKDFVDYEAKLTHYKNKGWEAQKSGTTFQANTIEKSITGLRRAAALVKYALLYCLKLGSKDALSDLKEVWNKKQFIQLTYDKDPQAEEITAIFNKIMRPGDSSTVSGKTKSLQNPPQDSTKKDLVQPKRPEPLPLPEQPPSPRKKQQSDSKQKDSLQHEPPLEQPPSPSKDRPSPLGPQPQPSEMPKEPVLPKFTSDSEASDEEDETSEPPLALQPPASEPQTGKAIASDDKPAVKPIPEEPPLQAKKVDLSKMTKEEYIAYIKDRKKNGIADLYEGMWLFTPEYWDLFEKEEIEAIDFTKTNVAKMGFDDLFGEGKKFFNSLGKLNSENLTKFAKFFERAHVRLLSPEQICSIDFAKADINKKVYEHLFFDPTILSKVKNPGPLLQFFDVTDWAQLTPDQIKEIDFTKITVTQEIFNCLFGSRTIKEKTGGIWQLPSKAHNVKNLESPNLNILLPFFDREQWDALTPKQRENVDMTKAMIDQKKFAALFGAYEYDENKYNSWMPLHELHRERLAHYKGANLHVLLPFFTKSHWHALDEAQWKSIDVNQLNESMKKFYQDEQEQRALQAALPKSGPEPEPKPEKIDYLGDMRLRAIKEGLDLRLKYILPSEEFYQEMLRFTPAVWETFEDSDIKKIKFTDFPMNKETFLNIFGSEQSSKNHFKCLKKLSADNLTALVQFFDRAHAEALGDTLTTVDFAKANISKEVFKNIFGGHRLTEDQKTVIFFLNGDDLTALIKFFEQVHVNALQDKQVDEITFSKANINKEVFHFLFGISGGITADHRNRLQTLAAQNLKALVESFAWMHFFFLTPEQWQVIEGITPDEVTPETLQRIDHEAKRRAKK